MAGVLLGGVRLGAGRTKAIVPVAGATPEELLADAQAAAALRPDIVEWRVDHLADAGGDPAGVVAAGRRLVAALGGLPVLFTFRTADEGGAASLTPDAWVRLHRAVLDAGLVQGVDVELRFDAAAGDAVVAAAHDAGVPVVGSFHDFAATPPAASLDAHVDAMVARGFDVAKLAVMPADPGDVLTLMRAAWDATRRHPSVPVVAVSMGGLGLVSRLAGEAVGSCATFASTGRPVAPGQVPLGRLRPVLDLVHDALPGAGAPRRAVALIGLPGAGKSTVGPLLAERLGVPHHDVDAVIERRAGRPVRAIFAAEGEAAFRVLERDATLELLREPGVLSLGGGAPLTAEVAQALAGHPVVWLRVSPAVAAARVGTDANRPLLAGHDAAARLGDLLDRRGGTYAALATLTVDTDGDAVDDVVAAIADHLASCDA